MQWGYSNSDDVWDYLKTLQETNFTKRAINNYTKVVFIKEGSNEIEAMPHLSDKDYSFKALDNWVHHMKHPNVHKLGKTFFRDIINGHYTA